MEEPVDRVTLTPIEEEGYSNGTYEVKTVCPIVGKPLMITYHYAQDDLDEYIREYASFVEYIVSIVRIEV